MKPTQRAYLMMHICVFLWGFTAILGKLISLNEVVLVWYRMLMTSVVLLFFPGLIKSLRQLKIRDYAIIIGIGAIVSIHWFCFYGAVKYANASVAVSCIAVTSFITAILEPVFTRSRFQKIDLFLGIFVIPGIYLISNASPAGFRSGIILGLLSAVLASIFSILNKKNTKKYTPQQITLLEMFGGWLFACLIMPIYIHYFPGTFHWLSSNDLWLLIFMSVFCTALPFLMSMIALKQISAFTSVFMINLEPVYGVVLAALILHENKQLNRNFYIGTAIILLAVFLKMIIATRYTKEEKTV